MRLSVLPVFVLLMTHSVMASDPCASCVPPCYQPMPNLPEQSAPDKTTFIAPTPQGETSGSTFSLGIQGFALRIPESTIRLPTIQFPSFVRYRRGPEFLADNLRTSGISDSDLRLQFAPDRPDLTPQSGRDECVTRSQDQRVEQLAKNVEQMQQMMRQLMLAEQARQAMSGEAVHTKASDYFPAAPHHSGQQAAVWEASSAMSAPHMNSQHQLASQLYQQKCQEVEELTANLRELQQVCEALSSYQQNMLYEQKRDKMLKKLEQETDKTIPQMFPIQQVRHVNQMQPTMNSASQSTTMVPSKPETPSVELSTGDKYSPFGSQLNW